MRATSTQPLSRFSPRRQCISNLLLSLVVVRVRSSTASSSIQLAPVDAVLTPMSHAWHLVDCKRNLISKILHDLAESLLAVTQRF